MINGRWGPEKFTGNGLMYTASIEILFGGLALYILWSKGWRTSDFNLSFEKSHIIFGALLYLAISGVHYAIVNALQNNGLYIFDYKNLDVSLAAALIISVVNPIFEEFFVTVYAIERLEKFYGVFFTITLSAFVRFLYHMYQGPVAIVLLIMGLIHSYVYWRWRLVWPLIIAHVISNFISFYPI